MLFSLKGFGMPTIVAGLAALMTYATLGHVQVPTHPSAPAAKVTAATAAPSTDIQDLQGWLYSTTPPAPPPAPAPAPAEEPAPAAAADTTSTAPATAPAAGGYRAPAPAAPAPAPAPAIVIGSAQQSYINADRARAGLPPLSWSPCLAGIAAGQSAAMAARGSIFHGAGVSQDFGCGLGSRQTGENVGWWSGGINDAQLNTMFVNSAEHYANIVGPYHYVGTAWVVAPNGAAYITVEFG